jgi:hypothetical protein
MSCFMVTSLLAVIDLLARMEWLPNILVFGATKRVSVMSISYDQIHLYKPTYISAMSFETKDS